MYSDDGGRTFLPVGLEKLLNMVEEWINIVNILGSYFCLIAKQKNHIKESPPKKYSKYLKIPPIIKKYSRQFKNIEKLKNMKVI